MNETIKTYVRSNPKYSICIAIGIIVFVAIGLYAWTNTNSDIDTRPIQNATRELDNARGYNRQSIENNQRIGDAVVHSEVINERIESAVNRSIDSNNRATEAIGRSEALVKSARTDATNAKELIRESQRILDAAARNNQESTPQPTTSQTH